jgi:hypothetical protein
MTKKLLSFALSAILVSQVPAALRAGGFLETIDITAGTPSPIPGHLVGRVIPIRWDVRSIPAKYVVNTTLNPIPNPLGAPFLTVAAATAELQASMDPWNTIPTSYADMQIVGTVANPGLVGFDFRNELTFRTSAGFSAIASSPSVSLIADATFADGDDIDGDGDSDVSSAITVATDVDFDGDIEFPAGFYRAGTILDNDVQFNTKTTNGFRFTIDPAAMDIVTRSVDLAAVAVHEFGHSIGLSHTLDNQIDATDGTGTSMFPFIDTGDPAAELSQRSLGSDDIAWASYHYPEGTASSGPAALQAGDVRFSQVYGLIQGAIEHGVLGQPVAGASVYALDRNADRFVSAGFSGTTQLSYNPANGGLFLVDPAFNILDGRYTIPVPKGSYAVGIEAVDGAPVAAGSISFTAQIGAIFGQQNFAEEFYNKNKEAAIEVRPGQDKNVHVNPGKVKSGVDLITTRNININAFGNRNFVGFTNSPAGLIYAVRVPAAQVTTVAAPFGNRIGFHTMAFDTFVADASVVPVFAEAMLATGTSNADGSVVSIDLANPLDRVSGFIGQDNDFAPFFLKNGHQLGKRVLRGIADGSITNLFLVLQVPTTTPFPGVSNLPPLIGLDGGVATNDVPIFGLSYVSSDGGATFTRNTMFNFRFSLVLTEPMP